MVQGTVKKLGRVTPVKIAHSKRQIAKSAQPKKKKINIEKAHKKFTSGMVAQTEKLLGERVGHLELIGGKGKKTKKVAKAGGSRKFG
ncbi:Fc.00g102700.m01.CDS01 [Cosmosporella sp. VM-42]